MTKRKVETIMIRIVIDSGTDQNEWLREKYAYKFIPLSVIMDEKDYLDEKQVTLEDVHSYMRAGNFPKTSQISPTDAKEVFEECRKNGEEVIYITLFKELSGTYQVAHNVAQEYKETHPEFKLAIVDSLGAAGGASLLAIQALEMVEAGYTFEEIVEETKWSAAHIEYGFTVDDMNWLAKGGRLPKAVGMVGSALKVKPYLTLNEKGIEKKGLVRGQDRVYSKIVKDVQNGVNEFKDQLIAISHVGHKENARMIQEKIQEAMPEAKTQIFEIGAVLAAHLGIGAVGVFYMTERPEKYVDVKD